MFVLDKRIYRNFVHVRGEGGGEEGGGGVRAVKKFSAIVCERSQQRFGIQVVQLRIWQ